MLPGTPEQTVDSDGDVVDDSGNAQSKVVPGTGKSGFDLDAVAAVHIAPYVVPAAASDAWLLAP